jgi:hypothetical protein
MNINDYVYFKPPRVVYCEECWTYPSLIAKDCVHCQGTRRAPVPLSELLPIGRFDISPGLKIWMKLQRSRDFKR